MTADQTSPISDRRVVALRPDGLGQRLRFLLEAMYLARLLGVDYAFEWRAKSSDVGFHAAPHARQVFARDYLAQHQITDARPRDYAPVERPFETLDEVRGLAEGYRGWRTGPKPIATLAPASLRLADKGLYRALFDTIGFSAPLKTALAAADAAALPDRAVAIHLRAGDIIYGRYRFDGRYTRKVIALPVARRLVEQLVGEGQSVVLFCQDPACADLFRERPSVIIGADLADPAFDPVQQALFEMTLMARCGRIYSGDSAFAQVAAKLADLDPINPAAAFGRDAEARIIEAELASGATLGDPVLHQAFAAWTAAELRRSEPPERSLPLVEMALRLDPGNALYALRRAALNYRRGHDDDAEAQVAALVEAERDLAPKDRRHALLRLLGPVPTERTDIETAAGRGAPWALYLMDHVRRAARGEPVTVWAPPPARPT